MCKDLLKVTIVERCRECSEPVENIIDYYAGEFLDSLGATGLNNLCDTCADYDDSGDLNIFGFLSRPSQH